MAVGRCGSMSGTVVYPLWEGDGGVLPSSLWYSSLVLPPKTPLNLRFRVYIFSLGGLPTPKIDRIYNTIL